MSIPKVIAFAVVAANALSPLFGSDLLEARDSRVGPDQSVVRGEVLPFSLEQVLAFFEDAFGRAPRKTSDNRFVFVDRDYADDKVTLSISSLGQNIGIILFAEGEYGMSRLREFFEAPFFLRSESEQLYALLDAGPDVREVNLGRFYVRIHLSTTRYQVIVAMEFRPPGAATGPA
ncbi:MAG TPA: hypothetical protein VIT91_16120 [Chthoniobacterales bacterium]